MKVLSTFNGISCGRVALERAGIEVERYVSFEIDKYANKVAQKNYPDDEYYGDVFEADFTQFKGFDLLIGGSPCTHWSVARTNGTREITNSGIGWEFFKQYIRALKESKCKYFIYENNYSISKDIKDAITKELGVMPIMINSNLVSAQDRKRMYWTNIPGVEQPQDRGIKFNEVVRKDREWFDILPWSLKVWGSKRKIDTLRTLDAEKSFCLTTNKSHPKNYYLNSDRNKMTKLNSEEAEILQTLPKGYTACIPEGKRFKAIGNGWTVEVIAHILSYLK